MTRVVLDTDVLSNLLRAFRLREESIIVERARKYLALQTRFTISIVTRYEVLRGFKAKGALRQERVFERFCANNTVLPIMEQVIVQAAEIWADLRKRGELIPDADILIAATVLADGCGLATNNERHFRRVTGLTVENWLKP
jgi:tRNA(fMet)-specific endonuclease VapC